MLLLGKITHFRQKETLEDEAFEKDRRVKELSEQFEEAEISKTNLQNDVSSLNERILVFEESEDRYKKQLQEMEVRLTEVEMRIHDFHVCGNCYTSNHCCEHYL